MTPPFPLARGPAEGLLAASVHALQDSVRVESPLPGGLSALARFLFNMPQWIQFSALALCLLAVAAALALGWVRRARLHQWLRTRTPQVLLALTVAAVLATAGVVSAGAYGWHYTQHDNGFCVGCHIMSEPYGRFTRSQHAQLECHACHQQSLYASARQVYLWVAERPAEIGPHAKVPNERCATCHVTGQKEVWQRIASTAGHRVHLESDSSVLAGLQCVTCHGVEVHQFAPISRTCGQAGCHESIDITLGKMQSQTSLHCVTCHQFTAEVPGLATRDSAAGTLVPGERQCMTCHARQPGTAGFDVSADPHGGTCGMCHKPHTQRVARDAAQTCVSCHADWRREPFHSGVRHGNVASRCTLCHEPHRARVDASDCAGCHQAVAGRRAGTRTLAPPLPFDTTAALRGAMLDRHEDFPRGKGDMPPPEPPPRVGRASAPPDSFPHARHTAIACVTCHVSQREHGRLAFEQPRGCQICHHQRPAQAACATCHTTASLAGPLAVSLRVAVRDAPVRERRVEFRHAQHPSVACVACHTTPVSLVPEAAVTTCTSCHESHHAAGGTCSACHASGALDTAHRPGLTSHTGCDRCHRLETVTSLVPTRALCLTCHAKQEDHHPARECTTCHFQEQPAAYRRHLVSGERRR